MIQTKCGQKLKDDAKVTSHLILFCYKNSTTN